MKKIPFIILGLLFIGPYSQAQLLPEARYFTGTVKVVRGQTTTCYLEALFSRDLGQVQTRLISTLQHLSPSNQLIWIAVGPITSNFSFQRSLYRFQDPTPRALVKDLVVNVSSQGTPLKHALLYWHSSAGHHDPVVCDGLVEKTSSQELREVEQAFSRFNQLKP
ncbi:MAG: hypothetical protein ACK5V3_01535 [Bdellovibrionales bacterium]